jgi:hypothetical protein
VCFGVNGRQVLGHLSSTHCIHIRPTVAFEVSVGAAPRVYISIGGVPFDFNKENLGADGAYKEPELAPKIR